jgi:ribonuclease Y
MVTTIIVVFLIALFVGAGVGYYFRMLAARGQEGSAEIKAQEIVIQAKADAQKILDDAKKKAEDKEAELKKKEEAHQAELKDTEKRLIKKEELLDGRQSEIDKEVEDIKSRIEEVKKIKERISEADEAKRKEIEKVAKLTQEEAKELLLKEVEKNAEEDLLVRTQKLEMDAHDKLDQTGQRHPLNSDSTTRLINCRRNHDDLCSNSK